jgi:hypothetical protein
VILEAARAIILWIGKHRQLLTRQAGVERAEFEQRLEQLGTRCSIEESLPTVGLRVRAGWVKRQFQVSGIIGFRA